MAKLTEEQEQLVGAIELRFECIRDVLKDLKLGFGVKPKDMDVDIIKYNSTRMQFEFTLCMLDVTALDGDTKVDIQDKLACLLTEYYNLVRSYMCIIVNEKHLGGQGVKSEVDSMNCSYLRAQKALDHCEGFLKYHVWKNTIKQKYFVWKTASRMYSSDDYSREILTSMPEVLGELLSVENAQKYSKV